jgi:hypothetical protein
VLAAIAGLGRRHSRQRLSAKSGAMDALLWLEGARNPQ